MAIHYENYKAFSKGQGYLGSRCRAISPQAKTPRWKATDCQACKNSLVDMPVISRGAEVGIITSVTGSIVIIERKHATSILVSYGDLDVDWAPLSIAQIFGIRAGNDA